MKEESLNDKIIANCMGTPVVCTKIIKDVKEAVKKLMESKKIAKLLKQAKERRENAEILAFESAECSEVLGMNKMRSLFLSEIKEIFGGALV